MTLMEQLKKEICDGNIKPIFKHTELKEANIKDPNNNLSNYDKKNEGSSNKNKKVLVSREIEGETYYAFDEQLFE